MENKYITVSALNRYIQYKFDNDVHLQTVFIKAEISNLRLSKGILYFVLKDDESEIDGLMFQNMVNRLKFQPIDGMNVLATGKVTVYQKRGRYSINVFALEEAGLGDAYLNFLRLKEKLEKEGLFDQKYKKPIPSMSENIGVITSATGDALHDITSTVNKRFPLAKITLYPALVQGSEAPNDLIRALKKATTENKVDVIIIGRGGGSVEDLSCFNDEQLAKAIFASPIPTVSAVGHESDYTICDFVASLRAPTPTGAAVLVTKDQQEIFATIEFYERQLTHTTKQKLIRCFQEYQSISTTYGLQQFSQSIEQRDDRLKQIVQHLELLNPKRIIDMHLKTISDLQLRLHLLHLDDRINEKIEYVHQMQHKTLELTQLMLINIEQRIHHTIEKLVLVNPLHLMQKGYTLTYQNNRLVTSIKQVNRKDRLTVRFEDGKIVTDIVEVVDEKLS